MTDNNPTVGQLESLVRKLQAQRQEHVDAIAAIDESFASLGIDAAVPKRKRGRPIKPKARVKNGRKKAAKKAATKTKHKGWTAAQKKAHSKMMKKRWAGKKKEKKASKKTGRKKTKTKTKTKRKMTQTPALIAARKVQAQYMTRLRQLNSSDKAKVKVVVKKDGVKAAVKLANKILKG